MYYIIEKQEQLEKLQCSDSAFIHLITSNPSYHPKLTRPSLVYYNNGEKGYIFAIEHSESFSLDIKSVEDFLNRHTKIYLLDKKSHSYHLNLPKAIDLNLVSLDSTNSIKEFNCDTQFHRAFYQNKMNLSNIDCLIPISKHYEKCECFYDQVKYLIGLEKDAISQEDDILNAYKIVEQNGIGVKEEYIKEIYSLQNSSGAIRDNIVYSQYNLYNTTARPTNSFGGINFLAIPKEGDFRKCFVPLNDYFVEFDFDSYHLRLISKLIGFSEQYESMHKYLGRQYYEKQDLSEEEYKQSKTITFRQLYGGVEDQYKHIEFFSKIEDYATLQWKKYKAEQSYILPTGRVLNRHSSITKYKLFNYILQNLETKTNVQKILRLNEYLINKKTKLVLITYDAFLLDFSVQDGKSTLIEIKEILQLEGFPVNHKYGTDYSFT